MDSVGSDKKTKQEVEELCGEWIMLKKGRSMLKKGEELVSYISIMMVELNFPRNTGAGFGQLNHQDGYLGIFLDEVLMNGRRLM